MNRFFILMLLLVFCASVVYGSNYQKNYNNSSQLGEGWLIGIYGAFDTFYFNAKDDFFDEDNNRFNFYRYEEIQRAAGGGGYLGWGCGFCDYFSLAFQFAGTGYASSAQYISCYINTGDSFLNEIRAKYSFDLSFLPGALIGDCLLLYAKIGATVVGIRQSYSIIDNAPPYGTLIKKNRDDHLWGIVFGSGAQAAISRCITAFTEVVWHSYPTHLPSLTLDLPDRPPGSNIQSHLNRIFAFGFRGGVSWTF